VHPSYGTLKDFRGFLDAAHARGLRVITELVINPHERPAPVVSGGAAGASGIEEARFLRVERHGHEVSGRPDHLQ
jgi:maltose alpha-D-glucosyltransferase/alpha-amylase